MAIEEHRPLPKSIVEAPVLDEMTGQYYKMFGHLSRARQFTAYGVSIPITFEAFDRYAARFEIEDFEEFFYIMSGIDEGYLKAEAKRKAAEERKSKRDAKRNARSKNNTQK